jgi:hypothetical protein
MTDACSAIAIDMMALASIMVTNGKPSSSTVSEWPTTPVAIPHRDVTLLMTRLVLCFPSRPWHPLQ